ESMCDEAENILTPESMGMPAGHPEVTEVIVELAQQDGKTHIQMTHVGVPADSGGAGGWVQAFDSLEQQLSST
ncbi:MAG: SRPBCC domain-containing protein, partial [Pseudomonadota bacterium]